MKKRIFAACLILVMLCSILPHTVFASTWDLVNKYANTGRKGTSIFTNTPEDTPKETTKPTEPASKAAKTGNPPAMDEAFPDYTQISEGTDDFGNARLVYGYFTSIRGMKNAIEDYIGVLEEYGYTLVKTQNRKDYLFSYWLDSSDPSLKTITKEGYSAQLYIEGFSLDDDTNSIYLFYSPSIIGNYLEGGVDKEDSEGRSSPTPDSPSSLPDHKTTCGKCHGNRTISCSNCGGKGYKEKREPVPNYSGSGSRYATVKEDCYKCPPNGQITCPKCNGEGKT